MPMTDRQRREWRKARIEELRQQIRYAQHIRAEYGRVAEMAYHAEKYMCDELLQLESERRETRKEKTGKAFIK